MAENEGPKAANVQPKTKKKKAMSVTLTIASYALKVKSILSKAAVKMKILISLWQILQGLGATFSIPFPVQTLAEHFT